MIKSLNFIGEDSDKNVINISINDFKKYFDFGDDWDSLEKYTFTEGKFIIVIDPLYEIYKSGIDGLRCGSPNEIIILNSKDELDNFISLNSNRTIENLKTLGNTMMLNNFYEQAIYYYNEAIKKNDINDYNMDIILHSNLSEAYYKYGYNSKCISNANYCLNKINNLLENKSDDLKKLNTLKQQKVKALFRKIKGLVSFRKYKEAYDILFSSSKENPNKDIINDFIKMEPVKKLIDIIKNGNENSNGHYDLMQMLKDEKLNNNLTNFSDYKNPKIDFNFESQKGIKVTAKEKIKKGELIFVEKALVSSFRKPNQNTIFNNSLNFSNNNSSPAKQVELINKLTEKISKYPLDNEKFYYLYDGTNLELNIEQRKNFLIEQENGTKKVTKEKITGVIKHNKYVVGRYIIFYNEICIGVWGYASFLNHSCLPNTTFFAIGDFYLSLAIQDINIGDEITSSYCSLALSYDERQEKLMKYWGFNCNCELCNYENKKINDVKSENKDFTRGDKRNFDKFIKLFTNVITIETRKNIKIETVKFFEEFLNKHKKNLSCYELANGYLQLETHYSFLNDLNNTKKFCDLVNKYSKGKNYLFQVSSLYMLAICINELNLKNKGSYTKEMFLIMRDIEETLSEYTPFNKEQIKYMIQDNIDQHENDMNKRLEQNNKATGINY